ncbi:MAG: SprT-like domain-containing protein, partial [Nitrospinota bacterium]|nr:SprT-like domain-containing protein [Nitrospinota bacterium]
TTRIDSLSVENGTDASRLDLVRRLFNRLNRELFGASLPAPKLRLSRRMKSSAGSVQYGSAHRTLTISIPYHDHFGWDEEIVSTMKHEMLHLHLERTRGIRGHGKVFSDMCKALGTERYCKARPYAGPTYVYRCPMCETEHTYRKKVRLYCGSCHPAAGFRRTRLRLVRTTTPLPAAAVTAAERPREIPALAERTGRQLPLPGFEDVLPERTATRHRKRTPTGSSPR